MVIWFAFGLVLGVLVPNRLAGISLATVAWATAAATIAAAGGGRLSFDAADSVGVFAPLLIAVIGTLAGAFIRDRRHRADSTDA